MVVFFCPAPILIKWTTRSLMLRVWEKPDSSPAQSLGEDVYYLSFQNTFAFYILQYGHLLNSYLVEFLETLSLW